MLDFSWKGFYTGSSLGEYVGFLCVEYYSGVCLVVLKGDDGSVMVFFG